MIRSLPLTFYGCMLLLALGTWSCKKTPKTNPAAAPQLASTEAHTVNSALHYENKANPYDYMGLEHNGALEAANAYVQHTRDTNPIRLRIAIDQHYQQHYGKSVLASLEKNALRLAEYRKDEYKYFADVVLPEGKAKDYLKQLLEITQQLNSYEVYPAFNEAVKQLEQSVLNEQGLDEADRTALLVSTAIARHSAAFWINKVKETEKSRSGKRSFLHRLIRLHAYVTMDMINGFFAGITFSEDPAADAAAGSAIMLWYVDAFVP